MNNKRQTIWLVSMLSLMVILSAYYLFTEDAPVTDNASGIEQTEQYPDASKDSALNSDGISVSQVDSTTNEVTGIEPDGTADGEVTEEAAGTEGDPNAVSPEDEEVINRIANLKGNDLLETKLMEQQENISKKAEELRAKIADPKLSQDDAIYAAEELGRLEDTDSRITSLQEKLLQEFDNAVVSEEDANFKVIVLSDKLEKKQAVGIMDMATKELNVTPDRVTVQYVH
ncbi:SpoIIIAH-like family protein [Cohnella lupini]|uniref:Stage III sporulation protein AH n=1 Tax=Cohnella lupini TaxID=1294267 RepID=A0A3D9IKM6_9BACL|nr:SpoIIIAH-like family protein [Cohnella lupini]RED61656.1 stage III sporulation protein AH [Cohnella lupini]